MSHFGRSRPPDTCSLLILNISTTDNDLFRLIFPSLRIEGREVDGREITVQFAKYGPNAERIHRGRIIEKSPRGSGRSRSRSPRRSMSSRYRDDHWDRDYRRRSRSRSRDIYDRHHGRGGGYHYRSRSRSYSPDYGRSHDLGRYNVGRWSRSRSIESQSPRRSLSPHKTPTRGRRPVSRSPSPHLDSRNPSTRSPYQE